LFADWAHLNFVAIDVAKTKMMAGFGREDGGASARKTSLACSIASSYPRNGACVLLARSGDRPLQPRG